MTVSTTGSIAQFFPNGVTTHFPFGFKFFQSADLVVSWQDALGNIETLTLNSDYTVQGAGAENGGAIDTIGPPLPDGQLVVSRIMLATQLTSFRNQGEFFAEIHEDAFDKLVMLTQQNTDSQGRGLTVPLTDPLSINLEMPSALARASKVLAFDTLGQPTLSNLTLAALEEQPVLAEISANAAALSETNASASAVLAQEWAENPENTPVTPGLFSAHHWASKAAASAAFAGDPFAFQPIGGYIAIADDIVGVPVPSTSSNAYRYIKLTAADSYNTGVLTSESVSGSAPLVDATAVINLAGSPINGRTVRLINTERRVLRAGASGTVENDQLQGFLFGDGAGAYLSRLTLITYGAGGTATAHLGSLGNALPRVSDTVNGTPRAGLETRSKNIGVTVYMRIK